MNDKPLRVLCRRPGCTAIVAHLYGDKMISVKRGRNIIQTVGQDWSMICSCPFSNCYHKTSVICKDGKIDHSILEFAPETQEENLDIKNTQDESKKEEAATVEAATV